MKIISLDIYNFLTIGHAKLSLDEKGLVLIQGQNLDDSSATSNGSGKSSLPDAFCWVNYGTTARGESGDEVVNNTAKKDCCVIETLQDGDITYVITRHRKHKVGKNTTLVTATDAAGNVTELHKGTEKETQLVINEIMGCTLDVFMASIYAGQEVMPDLPKMTDKQLKALIEEAAGTELLEGAYKIALAELNAANTAATAAKHQVELVDQRMIGAKEALMRQRASQTAFEEQRPVRKATIQAEIDALDARIKEMEAKNPSEKSVQEFITERTQIVATLASVNELQKDVTVKDRAAQSALQALTNAQESITRNKKLIAELEVPTPATPSLEWMSKTCHACGKSHTLEEYGEWFAHTEQARENALATARANLTEALNTEREASVLQGQVANALAEAQKKIPDTSVQAARLAELDRYLKSVTLFRGQLSAEQGNLERLCKNLAAVDAEVNPHVATMRDTADSIRQLTADRTARLAAVTDTETQVELKKAVAAVFGPAGVRAHILDSVTPFLNERTSEYLSALSDGNISAIWSTLAETSKGEVREKFNIEVENEKGAKRFAGLSGGEKRKVRLATVLALQDLVATRATKNIGLWIGDEIDDAMDPAGLERLMTILEKKARDRGTVLVISHNELTDWCDQTVTVTKQGGYSKVEGVLCD